MGVQVPPAAPKVNMIKFIHKIIENILLSIFFIIVLSRLLFANDFYDYPMFFVVDACKITQQRNNPDNFSRDEILQGREKYSICMNFILSLSSTLNSRCLNLELTNLSPEENFTYADLSEVHTTQDIIKEVLLYSKKFPQFDNQIAWLHASKAISQKWPCIKNLDK